MSKAKISPFELSSTHKTVDSNSQGNDSEFSSPVLLQSTYSRDDQNNSFIKQIDKLKMLFSSYSDKYLNMKVDIDKITDALFINLFKQITLYVEEIDRLHQLLLEKDDDFKQKKDIVTKAETKELVYNKHLIKVLENKLIEKTHNEEKLKKELQSEKRQVIFYKEKMKMNFLHKDTKDKGVDDQKYMTTTPNSTSIGKQRKNAPASNRQVNAKKTNVNKLNNTFVVGNFGQMQIDTIPNKVLQTEQNESTSPRKINKRSKSKKNIHNNNTSRSDKKKNDLNSPTSENISNIISKTDKEEIESLAKEYNDIVTEELNLLIEEEDMLENLVCKYSKEKEKEKGKEKERGRDRGKDQQNNNDKAKQDNNDKAKQDNNTKDQQDKNTKDLQDKITQDKQDNDTQDKITQDKQENDTQEKNNKDKQDNNTPENNNKDKQDKNTQEDNDKDKQDNNSQEDNDNDIKDKSAT